MFLIFFQTKALRTSHTIVESFGTHQIIRYNWHKWSLGSSLCETNTVYTLADLYIWNGQIFYIWNIWFSYHHHRQHMAWMPVLGSILFSFRVQKIKWMDTEVLSTMYIHNCCCKCKPIQTSEILKMIYAQHKTNWFQQKLNWIQPKET